MTLVKCKVSTHSQSYCTVESETVSVDVNNPLMLAKTISADISAMLVVTYQMIDIEMSCIAKCTLNLWVHTPCRVLIVVLSGG